MLGARGSEATPSSCESERRSARHVEGIGTIAALPIQCAVDATRGWRGYGRVGGPLGDAKSIVQIGPLDEVSVGSSYDVAHFEGPTGALIGHRTGTPPVMSVHRFISGLHLIQFRQRLLLLGTTFAGYDRAALEIWTFYLAWLATFGHAWLRPRHAWIEQCWTMGALACAAVLLNWLTTGDHVARSLAHRHLWPVAGMDLLLLAGAAGAALTAVRLKRRAASSPARARLPDKQHA